MRIIDADELRDVWLNATNVSNYEPNDVLDSIYDQPTVDAVPVVHGRWEFRSFQYGEMPDYDLFCTVCNHNLGLPQWQYCPYCGAKMDLEDEI